MDIGKNVKDTKAYVMTTKPIYYHFFQFYSQGSDWYAICNLLNLAETSVCSFVISPTSFLISMKTVTILFTVVTSESDVEAQ